MTKNQFSRRDFFKLGAVGAAGAAAAGLAGCAPAADKAAAGSDAAGAADASAEGAVSTNDVVIKLGDTLPKWSFMVPPAPIPEDEITETIENDIIVVGAGMSGLTTAVAAAEQGGKVTLFSASSAPISRGGSNFARNSKVMEELKVEPFAPSPFYYHEMRAASFAVDQAKWMKGYNNSEEAMNWMIDIANEAGLQVILERDNNFDLGPHYAHAFSTLGDSSMVSTGQQGAVEALEKKALEYGVQIIYDMKAEQLIREGDRVAGVIVKNPDGSYGRINAGKGVILATGGYDANPELMEAWTRPEDYATSSWWNPGWGTTGDGHLMGIKVGAQMDPCPQPVMNFRWGNPDSFFDARTWNAIYFGLMINPEGKRFVREDLPFQGVSNAQNAQPGYGAGCFQVFDENMMEGMNDDATIQEFKDKGWLFEGATPQELGQAAGIDGENLAATIERYNGFFAGGVDEDFNRDLAVTMPFTGKRFFALTTNSCVLATVGGLTIDGNCQVLDTDDKVIGGLYAVGNASGNFFAGNYPRHIPGTSIGRAITFGYVAAEHAVKGE